MRSFIRKSLHLDKNGKNFPGWGPSWGPGLGLERHINALMALALSIVLWGAFSVQFFEQEYPCSLCLLQRLGMLGVALGALLNVKFGIRKSHYGLSLLSALLGGVVGLRQFALHVCPGFPTFGTPFWGLSLYTWSLVVFLCSIISIAFLLLVFDPEQADRVEGGNRPWWWQLAFLSVFLVAFTNIFTTFWQCGFGDCE